MKVRRFLHEITWTFERLIVPRLRYSQDVYADVLSTHVTREVRWLDIGCGHNILPYWRQNAEQELVRRPKLIVGLDYDSNSLKRHVSVSARVRGEIATLPFGDRSFDLVTANTVLEHLEHPLEQFREISRVLTPGGVFLFHTPNVVGYPTILARLIPERIKPQVVALMQGHKQADVFKTYYRANARRHLAKIGRQSGLELTKTRMIVSSAVFSVIPPLAVPELIWIRLLMTRPFRLFRTNIIGTFQKALT